MCNQATNSNNFYLLDKFKTMNIKLVLHLIKVSLKKEDRIQNSKAHIEMDTQMRATSMKSVKIKI